jgi:hypothetical protein
MALTFAADGDLTDHAAGSYNIHDGANSAGTGLIVCRPTSDTTRQTLAGHVGGGGSVGEYGINFRGDLAGDPFDMFRERVTTYLGATANASAFTAYALNQWLYIAWVWNTAGAATDQKLYMGSRTVPMTEATSYTAQTAGTGAVSSGSGIFRTGNHPTTTTRKFLGDIAFVTIIPAVLSIQELIRLQYCLLPVAGNRLYCHYGFPGTNSTDLSGNVTNGAVTGATNAAHVPMGSFAPSRQKAVVVPRPASSGAWLTS